ncbi:unnamed protein product [Spirodela intermedia]|uniref:Uncharacterized protein n=1 Tax=Spirodela intermedia TaxID=51605 RepID=A0A7I8LD84_SPIIN|nr:unnamed protein product [Spirodela intermedia]
MIFVPLRKLEPPAGPESPLAMSAFLLMTRAEVSMKKRLSLSANSLASSVGTARRVVRSDLLPTSMMTMFLSACPRSSSSHLAMWSNDCRLVMSYTSIAPTAPRTVRVWNSTPIVALESKLNSFLENRARSCDFPTAESPISTTLNT